MLRRTRRTGTTSKVRIGTRIVDIARRTVTGTGPQGDVALTPTEWQVLEVLIRRPGRLVSTQQLLTEAGTGFRFRPERAFATPNPALCMDFVRDFTWHAWTPLESGTALKLTYLLGRYSARLREAFMQDLAYIGLTILVFAVLFLLLKGVERFER
jgi:Transcriptional regulatory protein, C terminal